MKKLTKSLPTEEATLMFGAQLARAIKNGMIIFLYGPLGAGKTTLTRGILRGLGYDDKVKSPTYTLVETYFVNQHKLSHFDLYRLQDPDELEQIGIREYLSSDSICLIEWPEKGFPLLPNPDLACYIIFKDKGREIHLKANTKSGEKSLQKL